MHLDHIGLSVGDLDAQAAWYQEVLGFTGSLRLDVPQAGLRIAFLQSEEGVAIELLQRDGSAHPPAPTELGTAVLTQGFGHICLRVDDVADAYERILRSGGRSLLPPSPAPEAGVTMCYTTDPEGNLIELLDRRHPVTG